MGSKSLGLICLAGVVLLGAACSQQPAKESSAEESAIVVPPVVEPQAEVGKEESVTIPVLEDRVVSEDKGLFVRDLDGRRIKAISKGTQINGSRMLKNGELPERILNSEALMKYSWGVGTLEDQSILFAWEFTSPK